ncbi:hypothetical protein [Mycolicibacterium fortuitum]|uniref:Uncharacterized protein n=1 Tax=Mycolicibacterium fortuitum TaxID=1766 RepID=A0AAE4VJC1_MYCFO|nr:hypothetical protein [Mycolicibacterium fortuitum]MDV7194776.1 hypothetical protein [Mycolicibacterium fortuitum]MDV7207679.1 hypothetical protein [Mycolicibacterium fortuitum]MDV7229735.1 hypothetical protein [Mycolicibacterium fortuitum]MDV7261512.1 hypothetical protein [Mycolicibacterium fortuitum]MDV7286708.1 hypothetical protein [Mycolicibacterium fortuitum]
MSTFVDQEHFHDPDTGTVGDCWRACIASVTGCPIAEVPHFVQDHGGEWFEATNAWLAERYGERFWYYVGEEVARAENRAGETTREYVLLDGKSPRGDWYHVVVADAVTGQMVHDPHPSRAGLASITGVFALLPVAQSESGAA